MVIFQQNVEVLFLDVLLIPHFTPKKKDNQTKNLTNPVHLEASKQQEWRHCQTSTYISGYKQICKTIRINNDSQNRLTNTHP